jgi:hypothetical protein
MKSYYSVKLNGVMYVLLVELYFEAPSLLILMDLPTTTFYFNFHIMSGTL